ncbi:hypothetical protein [Thermococcus sp.]
MKCRFSIEWLMGNPFAVFGLFLALLGIFARKWGMIWSGLMLLLILYILREDEK